MKLFSGCFSSVDLFLLSTLESTMALFLLSVDMPHQIQFALKAVLWGFPASRTLPSNDRLREQWIPSFSVSNLSPAACQTLPSTVQLLCAGTGSVLTSGLVHPLETATLRSVRVLQVLPEPLVFHL